LDTRAAPQQSSPSPETLRLPVGLANPPRATPATNHFTSLLSPSITAQSPSSPLKRHKAQNADPPVEQIDDRSQSIEEDPRSNEAITLPSFETLPNDFKRVSTTNIATPCHTAPRLPGERELSPSLQVSAAQQSPSRSPLLQQRTQSTTWATFDVAPSDRPPQLGAVPTQGQDAVPNASWTRKRLRSRTGRGIEVPERRDDDPVQEPSVSSNTGRAGKRNAAETSRSSKTTQRTDNDPILSMARQIGHSDRNGEMQQMIQELRGGMDQALALAQPCPDAAIPSSEQDLARLFHVVPTVARQIEESTVCEQLSRMRNRLALAEFYRAYRAAQDQPAEFLRVAERILPSPAAPSTAPNRTKRTEVKERFIDLVFDQSNGKRNRKKDSTRVNDWQTLGRPWFDMISRFGNGVLLLIPSELTNYRQDALP